MDTSVIRETLQNMEARYQDKPSELVPWLYSLVQALCVELDAARRKEPHRLPTERQGITHKFQIGNQFQAYMNVGLYENGEPGELFLTVSDAKLEDHSLANTMHGLLDTISILTSTALQHGIPLEALVQKFAFTRFEPAGFTNNGTVPIAHSIVDYIFRWLGARFLKKEVRDAGTLE